MYIGCRWALLPFAQAFEIYGPHSDTLTHNSHCQTTTSPPKNLLGSGFSTPYTPFCLICTMSSELTCISHVHPFWVSRGWYPLGFSGRVRHPLDSKKLFVRVNDASIYMNESRISQMFGKKTKEPCMSIKDKRALYVQKRALYVDKRALHHIRKCMRMRAKQLLVWMMCQYVRMSDTTPKCLRKR